MTEKPPSGLVDALKRANRCYCRELGKDAPCAYCDGPDRTPDGPPDLLGRV